jgi:hypothetical protein
MIKILLLILLIVLGCVYFFYYIDNCINIDFPKYFDNFQFYIKDFFCTKKIDKDYLVAIVAFYGAIIAFFIPFTLDMSNKLKNQFASEIISKRFENEKIVKTLFIELLFNTFIALFILIYYDKLDECNHLVLSISNGIIVLIFVYSISIFIGIYTYANLIKKYTDTDQVLNMLQQEISNAIR